MENENGNGGERETFPLDDALISLLADFGKGQAQLEQQALQLNAQRQGALVLFIRQHGLQGNWSVAENGRELVSTPAAAVPKAGG